MGRGWHKHLKNAWVDGAPLPNIEAVGEAVNFPTDNYKPMALGPLGRGWPQRARYAGTYDDAWLADVFPFLPKDFDERYYQAAPEDQQLPLAKAPLRRGAAAASPPTARGSSRCRTSRRRCSVFPKRGERENLTATLDTIAFEPDAERFTMSWRVARPLKKRHARDRAGAGGPQGQGVVAAARAACGSCPTCGNCAPARNGH